MFFNLGVYASLALAANALLLPPNMAAEDFGDDNAMETFAINPFKRSVSVECSSCAYATAQGDVLLWTEDAGSSYLLDFEVGPREETLTIDGKQLYPPLSRPISGPFHVTQVNSASDSSSPLRLRVTGYSFQYSSAETVTEAGLELLPIHFRITSIESRSVKLPTITINLLKDVRGQLMIASFATVTASEERPIEQDKECKEWPLLCKWRSIFADKVNGMKTSIAKGCHQHKGRPMNTMEQETTHGKPPHRFRPGRPHPHHPHHMGKDGHGHHHHRMHMFFRRAFFTIFIPILIGIFAGTLTYLIGMALGCLVAIILDKYRGGQYEPIIAEYDDEDEEAQLRGEKEEYAELPGYEAPPVYEEAAEKEVVEGTVEE